MFAKLKSFTVNMIAGANVATVIVMLLTGYAGQLDAAAHPTLSSMSIVFPFMAAFNLLFLFFWLVFKWRMALIPFVGFLLAFVPMRTYCPVNLPASPPDDALKVLSWNVELYTGHPRYTDAFDVIYDYLRDTKADIVCLQEDHDEWRSKKKHIDELFAYNDTVRFKTTGSINAIGLHTRFPIVRRERISYTSRANGSMAWFLNVNGDTVIVINNHLESNHLSSDDRSHYQQIVQGYMQRDTARAESKRLLGKLAEAAAQRAPQAEAVHRYIEEHRGYRIIVCGDFNDHPLSYARHTVSDGLTDCYITTGNGPGWSFNLSGFNFRIDNIMCSPDIKPYQCKIDSKIDASDHYPIICWMKMPLKP